jgi:hypothetical protein
LKPSTQPKRTDLAWVWRSVVLLSKRTVGGYGPHRLAVRAQHLSLICERRAKTPWEKRGPSLECTKKSGSGSFSSELRVPSGERLFEFVVEDLGPRLQQKMDATRGPSFAADQDEGSQRGSRRPIPPLVPKVQVTTTNEGARAQGGLTPDFMALSL